MYIFMNVIVCELRNDCSSSTNGGSDRTADGNEKCDGVAAASKSALQKYPCMPTKKTSECVRKLLSGNAEASDHSHDIVLEGRDGGSDRTAGAPDAEQAGAQICPKLPVALVARLVPRKEVAGNPKARAAADLEWSKLIEQAICFHPKTGRLKRDVKREVDAAGKTVHFGTLCELVYETGSELPDGHPDRKMKGRVVFWGIE